MASQAIYSYTPGQIWPMGQNLTPMFEVVSSVLFDNGAMRPFTMPVCANNDFIIKAYL